jgi:tetratricopeptide (TPR) repeat protein
MQTFRWAIVAAALGVSACATAISGSADSITKLEQARKSRPNSEVAVRNLGIAYFKATPPRLEQAATALRQATTMNPNDGVAALYLGLTAEAQNDFQQARKAYEAYIALGKTRSVKNQINARLAFIARKENAAAAKLAIAQEQRLGGTPGPRTTVAVMPFRFTGSDTSLKPLERGLAELVVTDLSRSKALKVVERTQLQALLDEIQLQQTAGVSAGTGVRVGKILQAGSLVGGSISQLPTNQLNTSASVTLVQTTRAAGSGFTGQTTVEQFFALEKNLVLKMFQDLGVTLTTAERNAIEQRPTRSMAAFLAYSRGLELQDLGRFDEASRAYDNALRLDPSFGAAQQKGQEARNASAGGAVTPQTVEAGLRGTSEGAVVTAAIQGSTSSGTSAGGTVAGIADGLNPSTAGGATSLGGTVVNPPGLDVSAGTGGDNPTSKTAKVTIVIRQP